MTIERMRHLVALPLAAAVVVIDSASWVLSACSDLVLVVMLYAAMTINRKS